MSLRNTISNFAKGGSNVYAYVEAIEKGLCTCIVHGTQQRLTNLTMADSKIVVGDNVLIDYSSGVPPFVRRLSDVLVDEEYDLAEAGHERNVEDDFPGAIGFSAYSSSNQSLISNVWTEVLFDTEHFDDNNFLSATRDSRISFSYPGLYLITAQIAVVGIEDNTHPVDWVTATTNFSYQEIFKTSNDKRFAEVALVSTGQGVFAYRQMYFFWSYPSTFPAIRSLSGQVLINSGDAVYMKIKLTANQAQATILASEDHIYPQISGQLINFNAGDNTILGLS